MLPHSDRWRSNDPMAGLEGSSPAPGLCGRVVHIALALYLMPVIVLVLLVGLTAVTSTGLARAAGRLLPARTVMGIRKDFKPARRAPLASRASRSRSL